MWEMPFIASRHMRSVQAYTACLGVSPEQAQPLLRKARVTVLGCGGLGGYVVELLARAGVGTLRLVDDDRFTSGNLNRQLFCTEATLSQSKVEVAAQRVKAIDSTLHVEPYCCRLNEANALSLLDASTVVVDALDSIPSRRLAAAATATLHMPLVYGAVAGFLGLAAVIFPGSSMLERLYPLTDAKAPPEHQDSVGVAAPTPAMVAAVQATETLKLLLGAPKATLLHDRFFLCDLGVPFAGVVPDGASSPADGRDGQQTVCH